MSRNDFINKMNICLKELRESLVCLKIIIRKPLIQKNEKLDNAFDECNQLISIFVKSVETAEKNRDISKIMAESELPKEMQEYVQFIKTSLGVPIRYISNGPGRDQIIEIKS